MWWKRRALLWAFIKRDIQERLAGSILGPFQLILQPLIQILIFIFLFKYIYKVRIRLGTGFEEDFMRFFLTGFIPWSIHAEAILRGSNSLLAQGHLLTKAAFPAEILPLSATISAYCLGLPALFLLAFILHLTGPLNQFCLFSLGWLMVQFFFSLGVVLFLAGILVYIRDLQQFLGSIMMIWFYASPILYSVEMLPQKIRFLLWLNPFTYFVFVWHSLFLKYPFYWKNFLLASFFALLTLGAGWLFFKKLKDGFADVL